MGLRSFLAKAFSFGLYDPKWRCNACGKEIFYGKYFCGNCEKELPYNDKTVCEHCGREIKNPADYCTTCKGVLVSVDKARSAFCYRKPVSGLIKKAKYANAKYLFDFFAEKLAYIYLKNGFATETVCFVPMSAQRLKKRKYNQSEILARKVAALINLPVSDCIVKTKETKRQAGLGRTERLKNLTDSFRVADKVSVRGKNVLLIDDVTTTGATAEAVSAKLKKAGAIRVFFLSVASVPPKDGY